MEQIFIQKVFTLTEQILRGEHSFDPMLIELQNHLARAQKNKMLRYEAEVLNTLAILHLVAGNNSQAQAYFSQGLERANPTNDTDLKMKLLSNLSETCMSAWDLDAAHHYLDQAIALINPTIMNSLVSLYVHGNKVNCWVLQGNFAQAATMLVETWKHVENADLMKYSKYEYFQVILQLRNHAVSAYLALNQYEAALNSLQIAEGLVRDTKSTDLKIATQLSRMYYELLCNKDELAARQTEQTANQISGGKFAYNIMLIIASYMKHTHQNEWARKYAHLVLDEAASGQAISASAIAYAENILKVVA